MQNKLPERLKKLRNDSGLSQAKLAAILSIPQQTYDTWEQGKYQPDIERMIQIALYYDVTVDYLIGLNNDVSQANSVNIGNGSNGSTFSKIKINQKK